MKLVIRSWKQISLTFFILVSLQAHAIESRREQDSSQVSNGESLPPPPQVQLGIENPQHLAFSMAMALETKEAMLRMSPEQRQKLVAEVTEFLKVCSGHFEGCRLKKWGLLHYPEAVMAYGMLTVASMAQMIDGLANPSNPLHGIGAIPFFAVFATGVIGNVASVK